MTTESEDIDLIDFIDLINFTLSNKFIEVWRHKYNEGFIKTFQLKILECFKNQKPIKKTTLTTFLKKNHKYSDVQINNFYRSIQIEFYNPLVQ